MSVSKQPQSEPKRVAKRIVKTPGQPTRVVNFGTKPTVKMTVGDRWHRLLRIANPKNFREEWMSRAGVIRLGKIAGFGLLALILVFVYFGKDLPSPDKINARVSAQTTKFYDRTGNTLLYEVYGDKNRSIIPFDQMSPNIKNATVAVEDKNFYKHGAFSSIGILRAVFIDFFHRGSGIQGGSTITQQYVKNALLTDQRTFTRKIRELILSIEIEQLYKKDDILKLYLNEIPYSSQAYGIQSASRTYFNKDAKDLTLDEAALLASIPQAPTYYSPYGQHLSALVARKNLVLDLMAEQKMITKDQAEGAKKVDTLAKIPKIRNINANKLAPSFVDYIQEMLEAKYGTTAIDEGGYKVITTLDLDKQKMAEDAIAGNMATVRRYGGSNAAMAVSDPKTGQMLAMVGNCGTSVPGCGEFNVATAERQPGSSFKPFVYATAFKKNYGPGTTLYDVQTDFGGGYIPKNYTGKFYGVQSMRTAIAGSLNIPAVKTLYLAGIDDSIQTAHDLGITTLNDGAGKYGLSLVLGSGEVKLVDMVNAYGAFANEGTNVPQAYILKMTDPKGNVVQEFKQPTPKRVLDPQVAYLISSVLSDAGARAFVFGNYSPLQVPGHDAAVKTGTTNDYKDAWTVGYTPDIVAGVWAGNNDNRSMTISASSVSAPIWHDFMVADLKNTPNNPFKRPDGIKEVTLDANTGKLANDQTKVRRTDIFPSWYKPATQSDSQSAKVDRVSGKLATACTPPGAIDTVYSNAIVAEIPPSDPSYSRWEPPVAALAASLGYGNGGTLPTENDDKHSCSDTKPSINLTVTDHGGGSYIINAAITSGTFTANKVDIYFDDQLISTGAINGTSSYPSFTYTATVNGSHTFKAIVTDTGYYTGQDSQTVNIVDAGGNSFNVITPTTDVPAGNNRTFAWQPWSTATSYRLIIKRNGVDYAGSPIINGPATAKTINLIAGSYVWYVVAYNGSSPMATSNSVTFTAY